MHSSDAYSVFVAFHHFALSLSVSILLNEALGNENLLWPTLLQSGGFTSDSVCLVACALVLIGARLLDCIFSERFLLQGQNNMQALSREQKIMIY